MRSLIFLLTFARTNRTFSLLVSWRLIVRICLFPWQTLRYLVSYNATCPRRCVTLHILVANGMNIKFFIAISHSNSVSFTMYDQVRKISFLNGQRKRDPSWLVGVFQSKNNFSASSSNAMCFCLFRQPFNCKFHDRSACSNLLWEFLLI